MIDLEQLRKDMEAGTQGDWVVDCRGITSTSLHAMDCIVEHVYGSESDARRIARVPQLEREYIALREAADALARSLNDMIVEPDFFRPYARATLTRYEAPTREATK